MFKKIFYLTVVSLTLAGCAMWTQLTPSEYKDKKYLFSTVVPGHWMRFNAGRYFVITKDGVVLNYVRVYRQKFEAALEFTKKTFRADMTPQDWAEVETDEIVSGPNVGAFKTIKNVPVAIGGHEGFRLEYEYTAQGGLKKQGIACGFKVGNWMYRVQFEAAKQHYYAESAGHFERFVEKFQVL